MVDLLWAGIRGAKRADWVKKMGREKEVTLSIAAEKGGNLQYFFVLIIVYTQIKGPRYTDTAQIITSWLAEQHANAGPVSYVAH